MNNETNIKNDWVKYFFNDLYANLFLFKTPSEVEDIYSKLKSVVSFNNKKVFEQCSGVGQLLNRLEADDIEALGIDIIPSYCTAANKLNFKNKTMCEDATIFMLTNSFDLVINYNSSIGYFDNKLNTMIIKNAFDSLKQNGVYLIEIMNSYDVIRNYNPVVEYEKIINGSKYQITRTSSIDFETEFLLQNWLIVEDNSLIDNINTKFLMYTPNRLIHLLSSVGFVDVRIFDGFGCKFDISSKRLMIRAIKK